MLNFADIINNPDWVQAFQVTRSSGEFAAGGWTEFPPQMLTIYGATYPSTNEELQQVPEGDRVTGTITIWSAQQIFRTHRDGDTPGISDKILWQGNLYKISTVMPYVDYGVWGAIAVRMTGD